MGYQYYGLMLDANLRDLILRFFTGNYLAGFEKSMLTGGSVSIKIIFIFLFYLCQTYIPMEMNEWTSLALQKKSLSKPPVDLDHEIK